MQKRRLGRTGLMVSCIGLGAGGRIFMDRDYQGTDTPHRVINCALDEGINFIDTARSYYRSEQIIGKAIRGTKFGSFLATKTYLRRGSRVMKDIDISLKNLQIDRVDLYQIHNVIYRDELKAILDPNGALEVLKKAKRAGKINYIGVTGFCPDIIKECIQTEEFDTIQIPFNFIEKAQTEEILSLAKKFDLGIIIMSPLAGGTLKNIEAVLKFILSYEVSTVIPSCSTVEHMQMNAQIGRKLEPIPPEEKERLFLDIGDGFCRGCKLCDRVCPLELPISEIFRCETYLYFDASYARNRFRRLSKKIATCTDCGECEKACHYNLPIRTMLKRADHRLKKGRIENFVVDILRRVHVYDWAKKTYFDLHLPMPKR